LKIGKRIQSYHWGWERINLNKRLSPSQRPILANVIAFALVEEVKVR